MMARRLIILCTGFPLYPSAQSVAIVPVGLTRHRSGLYPLRCLSAHEAERTILQINAVQEKMRGLYGVEFAYASDEMYMIAGKPLPSYDSYGGFPQLENGVGMLRKFEREFLDELSNMKPLAVRAEHRRRVRNLGVRFS